MVLGVVFLLSATQACPNGASTQGQGRITVPRMRRPPHKGVYRSVMAGYTIEPVGHRCTSCKHACLSWEVLEHTVDGTKTVGRFDTRLAAQEWARYLVPEEAK